MQHLGADPVLTPYYIGADPGAAPVCRPGATPGCSTPYGTISGTRLSRATAALDGDPVLHWGARCLTRQKRR